jgi:hypothetical protein
MSIYEVLSLDIPILAYSILQQPRKTMTVKEYAKSLQEFRAELKEESEKIQMTWKNYFSDLTAKTVQTTRGNLSQFLSTPIESDTGDIQHIITEQIGQIAEQILPKIQFGLKEGYDGRFLIEAPQVEIPKARALGGRSFFQDLGFKIGRNNSAVFESLYFIQGGPNFDILEHLVRNRIGIYNSSHGIKIDQSTVTDCSLYNLLFLDGNFFVRNMDRFELQVRFDKGKESYELFNKELIEYMKVFRMEVHDSNVSVWQKKLGLGRGEEYILRIKTKDRSTLRAVITVVQKFIKGKDLVANSLRLGIWLAKEII